MAIFPHTLGVLSVAHSDNGGDGGIGGGQRCVQRKFCDVGSTMVVTEITSLRGPAGRAT